MQVFSSACLLSLPVRMMTLRWKKTYCSNTYRDTHAGETGYTTVNITLESTNALRCAYLVMEENEIMPDAQEVLDKGIVTTANKPMDILIEELDANTQYVVLAAAKGEEENVLASVKIATKAFSVPDKKHTLIFYYMGDNTGLETEMEANLRVIQGAAGHLIRLSDKNQVAVFYDNANGLH